MTVQTKDQDTSSIWQLKNTARITKTTIEFGFAIAAIVMAGAAIYTAAKGIALSSVLPAFLANPWVIAVIASVAAAYLITTAISSYQQLSSIEGAQGKAGANGKDADFTILLGDAIKSVKIVEKTIKEGDADVKKLYLELSDDKRKVLLGDGSDKALHVIFKDKDGKHQSKALEYEVKDNNVIVTSVDGEAVSGLADMKKALGVDGKTDLSAVTVSNQNLEALRNSISTKLADVAIEGVSKTTSKVA